MILSAIIPAYNPDPGRLQRTLAGLRAQTLPVDQWETVLVDNASTRFPPPDFPFEHGPANIRVTREATPGLTWARVHGIRESTGKLIVFVDDDNVLAPDYLTQAVEIFSRFPELGAAGGKALPEFESPPAPWINEFHGLLALRDLGNKELTAPGSQTTPVTSYPDIAPIGAGMVLRREAAEAWIKSCETDPPPADRTGNALSSSGDNDIVLRVLKQGWDAGYFPQLVLTHLISASRLSVTHLARLNRETQISWMRLLLRHNASPWPPISRNGAVLRKLKAWFSFKPWSSPAARIRYAGACGHFEGRIAQ